MDESDGSFPDSAGPAFTAGPVSTETPRVPPIAQPDTSVVPPSGKESQHKSDLFGNDDLFATDSIRTDNQKSTGAISKSASKTKDPLLPSEDSDDIFSTGAVPKSQPGKSNQKDPVQTDSKTDEDIFSAKSKKSTQSNKQKEPPLDDDLFSTKQEPPPLTDELEDEDDLFASSKVKTTIPKKQKPLDDDIFSSVPKSTKAKAGSDDLFSSGVAPMISTEPPPLAPPLDDDDDDIFATSSIKKKSAIAQV